MKQTCWIQDRTRCCAMAFLLLTLAAAVPAPAAELEEILVTATKREESLMDVPLAVSALSGSSLQEAGIESVAELEFYFPSMVVAENSGGGLVATALVTRGIGVNGNIPYFEPSTALFIDGAYRSRSSLGLDDLVNIERVEYLRGPQSTLYGRNASAGVLSIYTQRPRDEWGGFVDVTGSVESVGQDPFTVVLKGEASGPFSDRAGGGLSFTYRDAEDLYEVTGSPFIDSINGSREYSVRGQLEFKPSDAVNIRITGGIGDREHNGPATELFFDDAAFTGLLPLLESFNQGLRARQGGADLGAANATFDLLLSLGAVPTPAGVSVIPPHNGQWDRRIHLNDEKNGFIDGKDFALDIGVELANGWTLSAVTSFNEYEAFDEQDIDQVTLPIGRFEEGQEGESFSQEVRLSSEAGAGPVDWIVGAFFLKDEMRRQVEFQLGPDGPLLGVGINGDTGRFDGGVDTDSISAFGQLTWRANDRLDIGAGLRWIREEKDAFKTNSSYNGMGPASPVFLGGGFAAIFDATDSGSDNRSTSEVTYSINASYEATESVRIYGLHSRGFKSGGFNVVWGPIGQGEDGFEFGDETVSAFEVGLKGSFLDGRLQLSTAAYHQTHDDYQTAAFVGTIFNLSNAEEASTKGLETDIVWAPTDALRLNLNFAFTDAKYEKFALGPCDALDTPGANGFCDQSGEQLPFVSDFTANLGAEYEFTLQSGSVSVRADLALASEYNPDLVLASFLEQDGYERLNLRATWSTDRFDLTAFATNITDAQIVDWAGAANIIPGSSGQFVIQSGRSYGLTARLKF